MPAVAILVLAVVLAVGGGLVRSERTERTTMDRRRAERVARRDSPGDDDR